MPLTAHLKQKLDDFIQRYNGKVRLIRNKEREGLIRTRTRGAEEAHGEVRISSSNHSNCFKDSRRTI